MESLNNNLNEYLKLIEDGILSLDNDLLFKEILQKTESLLNLTDSNLAIEIQMNKVTVNRWKTGKTTPLPVMRKGIYLWIRNKAMKRLD